MTWAIGIVIVLAVLGTLFGGGKGRAKPQPRKAALGAPRASREYATIFENGEHRPVSSDQVAAMFADIRGRLKEHRATAKAMTKLADIFLETGTLDAEAYAAFSDAEKETANTLAAAEALNDKLYFNSDAASDRYWKLIDDLSEAEADIEAAREEIVSIQRDIENGEFIPQKRAKPQPVKKPPKGAKPNIRMLYRSLGDNECEWTILITARTGRSSFKGWSFDHDRDFNFNAKGVLCAHDLLTGQRISDFQTYLDQTAPVDGDWSH